jgi:hypothetical protein
MDGMSLLDVLRGVMLDPAEQAAYNEDPGAYLQQYGYDDVDPADLSEAFGLVADTLPPDQAQAAWAAASHEPFGALGSDTDGAAFGAPGLDAADLDADALDDALDGAPGDAYGDEPIVIDLDADDLATLSFGVGEPRDGEAPFEAALDQDRDGLADDVDLDGGLGPDSDGDGLIDAFDLDDGAGPEPGDPDDDGYADDDGDGIADEFDADGGGFGAHQPGGFGELDDPADTDIGSF